jgi:hypothetical protein
MIARLRTAAANEPWDALLAGVFGSRRQLYKRAAEFGHDADHAGSIYARLAGQPYPVIARCAQALADALSSALGQRVAPADVIIDAPPAHREVEFAVEIFLPKQDSYRPLRQVSPVVDALARTQFDEFVKRVRVFVAPDLHDSVNRLAALDHLVARAVDNA